MRVAERRHRLPNGICSLQIFKYHLDLEPHAPTGSRSLPSSAAPRGATRSLEATQSSTAPRATRQPPPFPRAPRASQQPLRRWRAHAPVPQHAVSLTTTPSCSPRRTRVCGARPSPGPRPNSEWALAKMALTRCVLLPPALFRSRWRGAGGGGCAAGRAAPPGCGPGPRELPALPALCGLERDGASAPLRASAGLRAFSEGED